MPMPLGCGLSPGLCLTRLCPSPQNSSLASVIVGVIQVLFTAGAALVMDRAGRRLLLALSGEARGLSPVRVVTPARLPLPVGGSVPRPLCCGRRRTSVPENKTDLTGALAAGQARAHGVTTSHCNLAMNLQGRCHWAPADNEETEGPGGEVT